MPDSPDLPDYTRWEDDTGQAYALRVASQAMWEVGSLLCRIGDRLLDAAYPGSSIDLDTEGDDESPVTV